MDTNYAALALVVDRSGSMESIASDVRGSVKQFIGDQKKESGRASLTVAQFDDKYELVYDFKDIKEVDEEKFAGAYSPRGSTALLDAIGRTTLAMQSRLDAMPEAERPKRVVMAVITDGYENASREFTIDKIKELIKEKEALGWDFMFMGATLDTIDVAKSMGFAFGKTAVYGTENFSNCMSSISSQITKARLDEEIKITEAQRKSMFGCSFASSCSAYS